MGVPNSEVGYTPVMPRREDHEVYKGHVVALGKKKAEIKIYKAQQAELNFFLFFFFYFRSHWLR